MPAKRKLQASVRDPQMLLNFLIMVFGSIEMSFPLVQQLFVANPSLYGLVLFGLAVLKAILRWFEQFTLTDKAVALPEQPQRLADPE